MSGEVGSAALEGRKPNEKVELHTLLSSHSGEGRDALGCHGHALVEH